MTVDRPIVGMRAGPGVGHSASGAHSKEALRRKETRVARLGSPLWDTVESGPTVAEHTVLLLPGGWCTAVFYRELMAEPALAGVRLVAATLPGHGGTPAPDDLSVQNYASLTAELAGRLGCTVVVGHSLGANVALEMVGSAAFTGPVLLLAPSFWGTGARG